MNSQLQTMQSLSADSLRAVMPMYREVTDGMLAQMTKEIMDMKVLQDGQWSALMDSVHQDLNTMRCMGGASLERAMAGHAARVARLVALYQSMMQSQRAPR